MQRKWYREPHVWFRTGCGCLLQAIILFPYWLAAVFWGIGAPRYGEHLPKAKWYSPYATNYSYYSLISAGKVKNPGESVHHIVPSLHPKAIEARDILNTYHIDINSEDNGRFLTEGGHFRQGLHSHKGIEEVTNRLKDGIVDGSFAETRKK